MALINFVRNFGNDGNSAIQPSARSGPYQQATMQVVTRTVALSSGDAPTPEKQMLRGEVAQLSHALSYAQNVAQQEADEAQRIKTQAATVISDEQAGFQRAALAFEQAAEDHRKQEIAVHNARLMAGFQGTLADAGNQIRI